MLVSRGDVGGGGEFKVPKCSGPRSGSRRRRAASAAGRRRSGQSSALRVFDHQFAARSAAVLRGRGGAPGAARTEPDQGARLFGDGDLRQRDHEVGGRRHARGLEQGVDEQLQGARARCSTPRSGLDADADEGRELIFGEARWRPRGRRAARCRPPRRRTSAEAVLEVDPEVFDGLAGELGLDAPCTANTSQAFGSALLERSRIARELGAEIGARERARAFSARQTRRRGRTRADPCRRLRARRARAR